MLIVHTSTPSPRPAASWLKRRVSVSQVGVSSDGTLDSTMTLPRASASRTSLRSVATAEKSGAD